MAIGAKDPDLETMHALRNQIRGCAEPLVVAEASHFVPEWGESSRQIHSESTDVLRGKSAVCGLIGYWEGTEQKTAAIH
jgi:hypothetical protein